MRNPGDRSVPGSGGAPDRFCASDWVSLVIVLGGAAVRIYHWLSGRSLWQDEAYLAFNILSRDILELARPLDLNQSAPYLFLAATEALTWVLGEGEYALRLIPLLASIAALVLLWRLGRRCLAPWAVPVALAMIAFLYPFVYYAQEFKQYSVEVLVVVTVFWLVAAVFENPARASRRFAWLGAFGAVAVFLSHTAPFVLAGAGAVCLYGRVRGQVPLMYTALFLVAGLWLGLFALNYLFFIRPAAENALMAHYWAFAYPGLPWTEKGARDLFRLANEFVNYLGYTGAHKAALVGLGVAGGYVALRNTRAVALAAVVGLGCFLLAVALGKVPFYGRLVLFVFPMGVWVVATGLGVFGRGVGRALGVVGAFLLLAPLWPHLQRSLVPIVVENQREVIARLVEARTGDEPVYVIFYAQPALTYYRSNVEPLPGSYTFGSVHRLWDAAPAGALRPPRSKPDLDRTLAEIEPLARHARFWVLVAHMQMQEPELLARIYAEHGYAPVTVIKDNGAAAYLFASARLN
jgi:hypothetical protein